MRDDTPGQPNTVRILRGSILIYRVFDIAEEINLVTAENTLQKASSQERMRLARPTKHAVIIRNAPIRLRMGEAPIQFGGATLKCEVSATVWDYGVVSILLQIPIQPGTTWGELVKFGDLLESEGQDSALNELGRQKSREISEILKVALKRPSERKLFEDYKIYFLEEVDGVQKTADLLSKADLPSLILGESKELLAEKNRAGILEYSYSYADNDIAVIDWNSAVILEPSGTRDIADILEFALTHLLEFRYYDDLLDHRLAELYDDIEADRRNIWRSHFAQTAREANTRFIEFSEFIERVDNSLKVVGDFYLAVIFRAALRRFRIRDWQESVTRKMNLLARVSELIQGEVNAQRGHLLEFIIILLILFEIVSAVFKSV